ncbi:MAG: hypothetical protein IH996_10240 [Proteobacteria bacterium]|nr:hypothetical protein [Pseudomonadota bacterium]
MEIEDRHPNVGKALAELDEKLKDEDKREGEVLERARPKSEFYRELGKAFTAAGPGDLKEGWDGPSCTLASTIIGDKFHASGSFERPPNLLFNLSYPGAKKVEQVKVEYSGTVVGNAITGHIERTYPESPSAASTVLGGSEDKKRVLMILSEDSREFRVMEDPSGNFPSFYTLKRPDDQPVNVES